MNNLEHKLNNLKNYPINVLKEALKEAEDRNYISKLRGMKKCPKCKYVYPLGDGVHHCKCV